jgi:hypothetical protein
MPDYRGFRALNERIDALEKRAQDAEERVNTPAQVAYAPVPPGRFAHVELADGTRYTLPVVERMAVAGQVSEGSDIVQLPDSGRVFASGLTRFRGSHDCLSGS